MGSKYVMIEYFFLEIIFISKRYSWHNFTELLRRKWCQQIYKNKNIYGEIMTQNARFSNQVPCFSSLNPSQDTPGVTGLFLQLRHASGTLYHLILDLAIVPQNSNLFLNLCYVTGFQGLILLSVFFCFFLWFVLLQLEHTKQGGYVRITNLIVSIYLV